MISPRLDLSTHTYYVNDQAMRTSVTQLVSKFFPPFRAKSIAASVARKRNVDPSVILEEWNQTSRKGTELHETIHHYLNGLQVTDDSQEFRSFLQFLDDHPTWTMMRTEMMVCNTEVPGGLAGSIDCLMLDDQGRYHLVDWKRTNKNLHQVYNHATALHPLEHLPASSIVKYGLQTNLYKYILSSCYNIKVDYMWIVQLGDTYQKLSIPSYDNEITAILKTLGSP
jgi:ATP-dependent exoDNAse (exonuclease V) beta subunit